jgi:uncharacterized integral membrane protein
MRIIYNVFLLLITLIVIGFAITNAQNVNLYYYLGQTSMPLSFALGIALAIGSILGILACLKKIIAAKYQIRVLKHELNLAKKEIINLRAIPIKDQH